MEASALPRGVGRHSPLPAALLRLRTDEQLVDLFRAGSDAAFRMLHDRYRPRLHAYVRQMLARRSPADVEDALQDTFERAHTSLRFGHQPPQVVRVWLYRVARNRCIDELRRRPPTDADVQAVSRLPGYDTDTVAERHALVTQLVSDLQELPEQQRSALLLRELNGLSHAELAATLDVSVGAVKSLLVRARTSLVQAEEARSIGCGTIRPQLAVCHDRGVKLSGPVRRHLRECPACRAYRADLRGLSRTFHGLASGLPWIAPIGLVGRLLGRGTPIGGQTSGAGTAAAGSGGLAISGATKLATLVCAAAIVTAGGVARTINGSGPAHRQPILASGSVSRAGHGHDVAALGTPRSSPGAGQPPAAQTSVGGDASPVVAGSSVPAADHSIGLPSTASAGQRVSSSSPALRSPSLEQVAGGLTPQVPNASPQVDQLASQAQGGAATAKELAASAVSAGNEVARAAVGAAGAAGMAGAAAGPADAAVGPAVDAPSRIEPPQPLTPALRRAPSTASLLGR